MRYFSALAFVLASSPAWAQQSAPAADHDEPAAEAETGPADDRTGAISDGDIVVVATRMRGEIEAPQTPIATFDEAEIQALGAGSVGELLSRVSPQTGSGRGRGSGGMPLVLVNGQRITNFREMRNYPPEAIKRVEILPEEVALRYGAPPNTRVVNLILKDNFSSRRIEANYAFPTRGGFNESKLQGTLLKLDKMNRFTVSGEVSNTSPLFESERNLTQAASSTPSVAADPNPADYRSLIADTRSYEMSAAWTKGLGKNGMGGSISLNGSANRTDSTSYSGLNTVLLTDLGGATALRSLPDPLERRTRTTTLAAGAGYNTSFGKWLFNATVDATHAEARTLIDRRADTSGLVSDAANGLLPITGPLPTLPSAGQDMTTNNSERVESLITLSGRPLRVPGGEVTATLKVGTTWIDFVSEDQRSGLGPVSLNRFRVQGGANIAVPLTSRREKFGAAIGDLTLNLTANLSHVSDFGAVNDWSAGLTWGPTEKLNLQASYIVNQETPSISQLGNPQVQTFNVPVYDFTRGETVLVTVTSGGNSALLREQQRDWKLSANWTLPIKDSNLIVEWFSNRSNDVTASFPLLTPAIEAAFPGRVTRDSSGRLIAIDQRPVTFASQQSSRLRWGFNTSGGIGKAPEGGGIMGMGGPPGGRPPGQGGPRPAGGAAAPAGGGAAAPAARPRGGGGGGRGGAMAAMFGGGGPPGRWSLGVFHSVQLENRVLISPTGPTLDLLNGDALSSSGSPRHSVEFNGGVFYKGFGGFFQGTWTGPSRIVSSALTGTSDLRFGSATSANLYLFAEFSMMQDLTKKVPFLQGARASLRFENLFDSVQSVTDGTGAVPLSYQRDYLNPRGRVIQLEFRKMF